jgi:nucleoside-triphosphatase THEP1
MIGLVTGEIGVGKTTVCRRALGLLRGQGVAARGVLSPARLDASGAKIGIDAVDVATCERRELADYVPEGGETIGSYTFRQETLVWAIAQLKAAVAAPRPGGDAGLLVVDEIGPLELVHQGGFAAILEPLADPKRVPHALIVVRRQYVDVLECLLGRSDGCRFGVDEARRDALPAQIVLALETIT